MICKMKFTKKEIVSDIWKRPNNT